MSIFIQIRARYIFLAGAIATIFIQFGKIISFEQESDGYIEQRARMKSNKVKLVI